MEINPNLVIRKSGYEIIIFSGVSDPMNEGNGNVDVQVSFDDGKYYTATLFTLKNVQTMLDQYKQTGECASGSYFFCTDLVIIEKLNMETIERMVSDLIENDELATAFDLHEEPK